MSITCADVEVVASLEGAVAVGVELAGVGPATVSKVRIITVVLARTTGVGPGL